MSAARPGKGVPPVTPVGLVATTSSVGGGGGRKKGRRKRGVNNLPPPVSEDVVVNVYVEWTLHLRPRLGSSASAKFRSQIQRLSPAFSTTIRIRTPTNLPRLRNSKNNPQLLPLPYIYTLSRLHHLYMRLLDDQEVYRPLESDGASASVDVVSGWMRRDALYEARLKADAGAVGRNGASGGLGLDELCLDEDEDEEGVSDDYDDEEFSRF